MLHWGEKFWKGRKCKLEYEINENQEEEILENCANEDNDNENKIKKIDCPDGWKIMIFHI